MHTIKNIINCGIAAIIAFIMTGMFVMGFFFFTIPTIIIFVIFLSVLFYTENRPMKGGHMVTFRNEPSIICKSKKAYQTTRYVHKYRSE